MRRAAVCLTILISLCNGACAGKAAPAPEPTPLAIYPARCARPAKPDLPRLSGLPLLESREGYARLKLRDRRMRAYIAGLEDALDCYETQLPQEHAARDGDGSRSGASRNRACGEAIARPAQDVRGRVITADALDCYDAQLPPKQEVR